MTHCIGKTGLVGHRSAMGAVVLCGLALCLSGCTMGTINLSGPDTSAATVSGISGKVIGGQQPVAGSLVKLYQVGTTGYGTGATAISGASTYTDTNGNFAIPSYTCPNGSALTYVVATGGNPGNGNLVSFTSIGVTGTPGAYVDTFTAANSFAVSNTVVLTGITNSSLTYLNGTTQTISAVASDNSTFSIADTSGSNPGAGTYATSGLASASGSVNTSIRLVAVTGKCSAASSQVVNINEVATAATAYALAQYVNPATGQIGSPSSTQATTGLANAFALIPLLVNGNTGLAISSSSLTGAGATLTAVPESDRLNTIADILAACVNSSGNSGSTSNCGILFANAGAATASDTFDAAVEMAQLPFNSAGQVTNLFNLASGTPPFVGLSAAPLDWTLGIQYQDNVGTFFIKPQNIAVDALGDVWVLSNSSGAGGLVEVGPTGTPLSVVSSLSEYGPFVSPIANPPVLSSPKTTTTTLTTQSTLVTSTFGGSPNIAMNPRNLAIDPSGNVWFTQTSGVGSTNGGSNGTTAIPISGNVFVVATSSGTPSGASYGFATGKSAYSIAIDAAGNTFIGEQSSSAYFGAYEFPYNATAGNALLIPAGFPPNASAVNAYMAIDKSGNKWYTNGTSAVYELTGAVATSCSNTTSSPSLCQPTGSAYTAITDSTTAFSTTTAPYGIAEGTTGMWIANSGTGTGGNTLVSVPFASSAGTAYGDATYLTAPKLPAVDGAGNVWVANGAGPNTTTNTTGGSVSALNSTGTFLSPTNGGSTSIGPGYNHLGLTFGVGTAIDPSGNVWVANNAAFSVACTLPLTTPSTTATSGGNTCSSIFEIVGSAVPVVTPISKQQANGPSKP